MATPMSVDSTGDFQPKLSAHTKRVFGQNLTNRRMNSEKAPRCSVAKPATHPEFAVPLQKHKQVKHQQLRVADWDMKDYHSDIHCVPYMRDIMQTMREAEEKTEQYRHTDFLVSQPEVDAARRTIVVEWMITVNWKYGLDSQALHTSVGIFDRFLRKKQVQAKHLQFIGSVCFWIAAKYHDNVCVTVETLQEICNMSHEDFVGGEECIVSALDYELTLITPFTFAQRFTKALRFGLEHREADFVEHFVMYLLDHSICDHFLTLEKPSLVAAAAVTFVLLVSKFSSWNDELERELGYSVANLRPTLIRISEIVNDSSKHTAVRRKYGHSAFAKVETVLKTVGVIRIEDMLDNTTVHVQTK